ncbi:unnamed protein product [Aphanomyces euteiches]|nr:hypothetical protein AeRB84_004199 [Aphanomyces euteiches]
MAKQRRKDSDDIIIKVPLKTTKKKKAKTMLLVQGKPSVIRAVQQTGKIKSVTVRKISSSPAKQAIQKTPPTPVQAKRPTVVQQKSKIVKSSVTVPKISSSPAKQAVQKTPPTPVQARRSTVVQQKSKIVKSSPIAPTPKMRNMDLQTETKPPSLEQAVQFMQKHIGKSDESDSESENDSSSKNFPGPVAKIALKDLSSDDEMDEQQKKLSSSTKQASKDSIKKTPATKASTTTIKRSAPGAGAEDIIKKRQRHSLLDDPLQDLNSKDEKISIKMGKTPKPINASLQTPSPALKKIKGKLSTPLASNNHENDSESDMEARPMTSKPTQKRLTTANVSDSDDEAEEYSEGITTRAKQPPKLKEGKLTPKQAITKGQMKTKPTTQAVNTQKLSDKPLQEKVLSKENAAMKVSESNHGKTPVKVSTKTAKLMPRDAAKPKKVKQQPKTKVLNQSQMSGPPSSPVPENKGNLEDAVKFMQKQFESHVENPDEVQDSQTLPKAGKLTFMNTLIDHAAADQWNLVEMGRLIRLFCFQWNCKRKKTTRFLRRNCAEFVCADFLEGLNIQLKVGQLIQLMRRGSASLSVLSSKLSACIEADILRISDDELLTSLGDIVDIATMTQDEIAEFLTPLIESCNKMDDACKLLHRVCEYWPIDTMQTFVQRVLLLNPVFDDLEGDPADISNYFPNCQFDLPNRMLRDLEDMDGSGNLKDFCVGEREEDIEYEVRSSADELEALEDKIQLKHGKKRLKKLSTPSNKTDDPDDESDDSEDSVDDEVDAVPVVESDDEDDGHWRQGPQPRRRSIYVLDEASEEEDYESSDQGSEED